ncbi:MAG: hypothetical protein HWQ38_01295 [Nostoc sp. NMS7]|uniref:hypothetical protein n=1 Tax=Nostoc sp. NMS7 TaxID=2815391 RepID=UPI0025F315E1|nr:hypothetical protein [Nostoc sp. NMS7]MBN3945184.1 hypothetical protein [Nostoc sp. NMS7]
MSDRSLYSTPITQRHGYFFCYLSIGIVLWSVDGIGKDSMHTFTHAPYPINFIRIKLEFFLDNDWCPHHIQSENTDILLALQDAEKQYDQYSVK